MTSSESTVLLTLVNTISAAPLRRAISLSCFAMTFATLFRKDESSPRVDLILLRVAIRPYDGLAVVE